MASMIDMDVALNSALNIILTADGGIGYIVNRCGWRRSERMFMPYLTTMPRLKTYGDCKMGITDARDIKIFTCEVRWPASTNDGYAQFVLGREDQAFVFSGTIVQLVSEFTKRNVAAISELSSVKFLDTWKPTVVSNSNRSGITMMRLFTIEIKVDFRDEDKLPLFKQIIQQAGKHIYGQSALLGDGIKPEIAIHAHDFFLGHQDIAMFDDDILAGQKAVEEATQVPFEPVLASAPTGSSEQDNVFSEELMKELGG